MTKHKKLKFVRIKWLDSACDRGWRDPLTGNGHVEIDSVGILVGENAKGVTISTSRSSAGHFMDQLSIPRTAITKIKQFKI